jgi:nitroreductase
MQLQKALTERRSIRRFKQTDVDKKDLTYLIDMARRAPSAANGQQLRYLIAVQPQVVREVFNRAAWAAYVKPKRDPIWGVSSPTAFIAVTAPKSGVSQEVNVGAAFQAISLAAHGIGLGTCWIGAFRKEEVAKILMIPNDRELLYLMAVGYPDETPVSEDVRAGESIKYYLDDEDVLHVPKISAEDLIEWH